MECAKEDLRFNAVAYASADGPALQPELEERIAKTCLKQLGTLT